MKFRKKPVVIEAHQWHKNGDHPEDNSRILDNLSLSEGEVVRYYRDPNVPGYMACAQCGNAAHVHGWIDTLEGGHRVCPGDWIITGVQGKRMMVDWSVVGPDIMNVLTL